MVHRPRYLDWSFPKGKREPADADDGLRAPGGAEETGFSTELGAELPSTTYRDAKHRPKRVRYWAMQRSTGPSRPTPRSTRCDWLPAARPAR